MRGHRFLSALSLVLLSACELSFDASLDGKRCDSEGACVSGYVCSPLSICEREGQLDASRADSAAVVDAGADARVEIEAGSRDAAIVLDAAEPQISAPAASTNEADTLDVTPDSGIAVAEADAQTAPDAGAPEGTNPDATTPDSGLDAAMPPPTTMPPVMMTPAAPPPAEEPGGGSPPLPGMMGPPPGPTHGCSAGRVKCGDECVNVEEDKDHCGACNNTCRKSESCDHGACKKSGP
jgi:hypothetical protein